MVALIAEMLCDGEGHKGSVLRATASGFGIGKPAFRGRGILRQHHGGLRTPFPYESIFC